jgi:hypothetical protein
MNQRSEGDTEQPSTKAINSPSSVPFVLTVCTRTFNLLIRSLLDPSNVDLTLANILGLLRDEAKREALSPRSKRWLADFEVSWGGLEMLTTQTNAHDIKFSVAAAALGQLSGLMVMLCPHSLSSLSPPKITSSISLLLTHATHTHTLSLS